MPSLQSMLNIRVDNVGVALLIILACFPIMPIDSLVDSGVRVWATRLSYVIAVIIAITSLRRFPVSTACALAYGGVILVSAVINDTGISEAIAIIYPMVGLSILMEWGVCNRGASFISILENIFFIMLLITLLLYPVSSELFGEGIYLIGGENHIILPTLAASSLSQIRYSIGKCSKRHAVFSYFVCSALTLLNFSGGGIVAWAIYSSLLVLLNLQSEAGRIVTLVKMLVVYVVSWWGLIVARIQNYFSWIIESVLGKSITLTHRTEIWDQVLDRLTDNYILGFGPQDTTNLFTITGNYDSGQAYSLTLSSHNFLLQTIYTGGIASTVPLIALFIVASKRLGSINTPVMRNALVCWIAGILTMMLVEATGVIQLVFPLSIACMVPFISNECVSEYNVTSV